VTPKEAIEVLEHSTDKEPTVTWGDYLKALNLGIEALKLNLSMRETYPHPELLVLPGETKK